MKKSGKKFFKNPKTKKIVLTSVSMFGLFAVSACSAFFLTKQNVTVIDQRTGNNGGNASLSGAERFVANLADSATSGLSIKVNEFKFDQFYVDSDGNEITSKGHNTITNGVTDSGESAPIEIDLRMEELSLHGINLAVTAPISYSNAGHDAKYRGVHASLLPYTVSEGNTEQTLFLNLFDNGNDTFAEDEHGDPVVEKTDGGTWDFKYKVSVEPKDSNELIEGITKTTDEATRGTEYYEYGELDWLLSDILDILSEGAINVSFEGWLDNLLGKGSAEETPVESTEESEPAVDNGISIDAIMDSMGKMQDVGTSEEPYFVWELPLGSIGNLVLGMGADSDFNLSHIDLPAKAVKDSEGKWSKATTVDPWKIKDGMTLSASADVSGNLPTVWQNRIYGNASEYRSLSDSASLFKKVAKLVAKPEFGIDGSITIGHNKAGVEGSRTVLKTDSVSEAAVIDLGANIDLYDDVNHKYGFKGLDVSLGIDKARAKNEPFAGHKIDVAYLEEGNDEEGRENNGYLNINDVLLAKTNKTYIDELVTDVKESVFMTKDEESGESTTDLSQIENLLDVIGINIGAILNSDLVNGINKGTYTAAADLIESLTAKDNEIDIKLTLAPIGVEGKVGVTLSALENKSLASISLEDISVASISLDGEINITDFTPVTALEAPQGKEFESLRHVRGIFDTVEKIASDKTITASISGALKDDEGNQTKLGIDGGIDFNFNEGIRSGKVDIGLSHYAESFKQKHNILLGLQDNLNTIAFQYDSKATAEEISAGFATQKTNNAIQGVVSTSAAKSALESIDGSFLLKFFTGEDRFSRLTSALLSQESGSLLGDLMGGQFFGLLENKHIISNVSLGETTSLTIDGAKLGMDEGTKIDVVISYQDNNGDQEGNLAGLDVKLKKGEVEKFALSLSDIGCIEGENASTTPIKAFSTTEGFDNYTPFVDLASELVNTLTMGVYANKENDKIASLEGKSNYGLEGSVGLEIAGYETTLYSFDAQAAVEGAETKIAANFDNLPVIRGVNAPDNDTYFRRNELEGKRDSNIYFYANGIDADGEFLLTRDSSYGRIRNVKDAVRVDGKDYTGDFLNWVLEYTIGVNESLLAKEEPATEPVAEPAEEETTSSWNPFANGVHVADCWGGFKASVHDHSTNYVIKANLGKLLGIGLLGDATVTLSSNDLKQGRFSARCLTGLDVTASVDAVSVSGSSMHIASVNVNLGLTNFGDIDEDGFMTIDSVLGEGSDYYNLFVKNVDDDGVIRDEAKGDLYGLINGFQSDDATNAYYSVYGYNFLNQANVKGGNYYL